MSTLYYGQEIHQPSRLPTKIRNPCTFTDLWLAHPHPHHTTNTLHVANRVRPRIAKRKEMPLAICNFEGTYSAKLFTVGHAGILCIVVATGIFLLTTQRRIA